MKNIDTLGSKAVHGINLPRQSTPVQRAHVGAAVAEAGASASFDWGSIVKSTLPILTNVLGGLF